MRSVTCNECHRYLYGNRLAMAHVMPDIKWNNLIASRLQGHTYSVYMAYRLLRRIDYTTIRSNKSLLLTCIDFMPRCSIYSHVVRWKRLR